MTKKIFKAILMGVKESAKLWFAIIMAMVSYLWLTFLSFMVLFIFKIDVDGETVLALAILSVLFGTMISNFVIHCIESMKYQEENKCDFSTAWQATVPDFDEY